MDRISRCPDVEAETPARRRTPFGASLLLAASLLAVACEGARAEEGASASPATTDTGDCPQSLEPAAPPPCGATATEPGAAPAAALPSVALGNPVSLVTGVKGQSEIDHAVDGAPLRLARHYSSANVDTDIGLGHGWRHAFSVALSATADGGRAVIDSTGRQVLFDPPAADGGAEDDAPASFPARLASDGHLLVPAEDEASTVWVVPDGRRLSFRGPYLIEIDWPDQRRLTMFYRQRRLATVTDETGRQLAFEYTPGSVRLGAYEPRVDGSQPGHLAAVVLPDGSRVEYAYDERRNLAAARFPDGTARRYHYEEALWPSHLTGLTERTGTRFASWAYDERGRAISSSHADGVERVTFAIEAPEDVPGGRVGEEGRTTVTASGGAVSVYRWRRDPRTGASQLLSAEGAGCATCPPTGRRYAYDGRGLLSGVTRVDEDGRTLGVSRRTHDGRGRLTRVEETLVGVDGREATRTVERLEYDGDSHRPSVRAGPSVNPDGEHRVATRYRADGLPLSITESGHAPVHAPVHAPGAGDRVGPVPGRFEPVSRTTTLDWDGDRLVGVDGPREDVDDVTRLEWDERERLVAIAPPAGPTLRVLRFDAHGRPLALRSGEASPVLIEYDAAGRVAAVVQGGTSTRYTHDAEGRVESVTDTDGRVVRIARDGAGRTESITDDLGRTTTVERDAESRITARTALGIDGSLIRSLSYFHDARGRVTRSSEDDGGPRGASVLEHESRAGGLVRSTRAQGGATLEAEVDVLERLVRLTRSGGETLTFGFDPLGRNVSLTDAGGETTLYPKDDFGRTVLIDSPDTGRVHLVHDAAGNVVEARRANGELTRASYDAANRPLMREDADGTSVWRWDEVSETLLEASNASSTERFEHDADGRLTRRVREIDGHRFETAYTRDARGRVVDKRLPDGQVLRHHYHEVGPEAGRLRAITRRGAFRLGGDTLVGEIDLDARDGVAGWTTLGGRRVEQRFAPDGELRSLSVSESLAIGYTFDAAGDIVGIEENGAVSRYAYRHGNLVSANTPHADYLWRYDESGNRLSAGEVGVDGTLRGTHYRYGPDGEGNRLSERRDALTGQLDLYRHDEGGAPFEIGALRYTYDAGQRPLTVHRGDTPVAAYAYDALGERVRKTVYGEDGVPSVTYFIHDGAALVAEADGEGDVTAQYVYLDGHRPVALLAGRERYAIHTDHLGAPRLMTDAAGEPVWEARYAPFGEATVTRASVELPLRLPGQYADAETGTYHNYLRDYDPATGRYLTADPIGLAGGLNGYRYAANRPLALVDPLGLAPVFGPQEDGSFHLTAEEYGRLQALGQANRRTEYYFLLYDLTGSTLAFEMAQISSNSGFVGGVAWNANYAIRDDFPDLYPTDANGMPSVQSFSEDIFRADLNAITHHLCTPDREAVYLLPNDLDMIRVTMGVWDGYGLLDVAPPLFREYMETSTVFLAGPGLAPGILGMDWISDALLPERYERSAQYVRDAVQQEILEENGFTLAEFVADHTEVEKIYTEDCETVMMRAPRSSRVPTLDPGQAALYDDVRAGPEHDIVVAAVTVEARLDCELARGR